MSWPIQRHGRGESSDSIPVSRSMSTKHRIAVEFASETRYPTHSMCHPKLTSTRKALAGLTQLFQLVSVYLGRLAVGIAGLGMASADLEGIGGLLIKFGGILMLRLGGAGEPSLLGQSLLGLDDEALSLGLLLSRYCRHVGLVGTGALWYRAVAMRATVK